MALNHTQQDELCTLKEQLRTIHIKLFQLNGSIDNQNLAQAAGNVEDAISDLEEIIP